MGDALTMFIETVFGFFALFSITKLLGKTQITQLTAFDFVSALILGELVGNALFDDKVGVWKMAYATALWGSLLYITELITQKFKRTRALVEGMPAIIIHKGKLQREQMKKNKLDINQLLHLLRSKNVFSIKEAEYAVLETDGSISVLKKSEHQSLTRQDVQVKAEPSKLTITLVSDGEIVKDNLIQIEKDETWLEKELTKHKIYSYKDVFYAEWKEGESLYVQPY